jgi:hypothetical protein
MIQVQREGEAKPSAIGKADFGRTIDRMPEKFFLEELTARNREK